MSACKQPEPVENRVRRRVERFDPFLAPQQIAAATIVVVVTRAVNIVS